MPENMGNIFLRMTEKRDRLIKREMDTQSKSLVSFYFSFDNLLKGLCGRIKLLGISWISLNSS